MFFHFFLKCRYVFLDSTRAYMCRYDDDDNDVVCVCHYVNRYSGWWLSLHCKC